MGREVRMVPPGWEHPKDENGDYIPLCNGLVGALTRFHREKAMWDAGYVWDYGEERFAPKEPGRHDGSYEDWAGERPEPSDYMPDWHPSICTLYQMYEDTSEGTPISPPMETPEKLAAWLADNKASAFGHDTATYEQWLATIKRGWACSAVFDSAGLRSGVAALADT